MQTLSPPTRRRSKETLVSTNDTEGLNRRGALLLAGLVSHPENRAIANELNALFYPLIVAHVRKRHRSLPSLVRKLAGHNVVVPELEPQDLEDAAQGTAWLTLERVRMNPGSFDPSKGTVVAWLINKASWAYLDVAKELARGSRRSVLRTLMEGDELTRTIDTRQQDTDPADLVLSQLAVDEAFGCLSEHERKAFDLQRRGFDYREIASMMFGAEAEPRRVEYLLRRARHKLAASWLDLKHPGPAPTLQRRAATDDKESR
jgi:DNA-directed RNA polymerase specialized sigma24 family protein